MVYFSLVRQTVKIGMLAPVLLAAAWGQEFEVASIRIDSPQSGFHFNGDAVSGGPGTADPSMFRCSGCSLATLIVKAFNLQPYQFPGRTSLTDNAYQLTAKIPAGATAGEFSVMLQNLLKNRFGLTSHFEEKKMKGYRLVIAKEGSKLKESTGPSPAPAAGDAHRAGQTESHNHSGPMVFGNSASYRASNQTTADLARILSDQIALPVSDDTGLAGKYDISLRWSSEGNGTAHAGNHGAGGWTGGHDGVVGDTPGPALFDALQQQLGLRLVPADQVVARLLVVDRVAQHPTDN